MSDMLKEIIQLVHHTRPLIMDQNKASDITVKGPADFVTQVDLSVQNFLRKALLEKYPQIQFMGEEDHLNTMDPEKPAWILDPIDGTTNLIYDFHHSAVSLGYYENHQIQMGVVYNPFTEETFWAKRGEGAFLNEQPICVRPTAALDNSLISIGTSPYDKDMAEENFHLFKTLFLKSLDIRRTGAASLDLAYTACGRLDGYLERNLKPWDFAAGAVILEEAGGIITTYDGSPVNYCKNQDILAGCPSIHPQLLELTKRL